MYKKIAVAVLVFVCLSMAGCSKDGDVNAFISEFDTVTNEIVKKVDANPSSAGVDDAQKYFDSKKADLQTKWDAIKNAAQARVSKEVMENLNKSVTKNTSAIGGLATKHMSSMSKDPQMGTKLSKLAQDYASVFK
jgi:hypothetical protein